MINLPGGLCAPADFCLPPLGRQGLRLIHTSCTACCQAGRGTGVRWPLWPFMRAAGYSISELARVFGISRKQIDHYMVYGLPDHVADEWAVTLGFHPTYIWGWRWVAAGLPPDGDEDPTAA